MDDLGVSLVQETLVVEIYGAAKDLPRETADCPSAMSDFRRFLVTSSHVLLLVTHRMLIRSVKQIHEQSKNQTTN